MLELISKLKDLKSLLGPEYYADLLALAKAVWVKDWVGVTDLAFDIARRFVHSKLDPVPMMAVGVKSYGEWHCPSDEFVLDAVLAKMEEPQAVGATADDAKAIDPATILFIITTIAELIRRLRG